MAKRRQSDKTIKSSWRHILSELQPTIADKIMYLIILSIAITLWVYPITTGLLKQSDTIFLIIYRQQVIEQASLNQDGIYTLTLDGISAAYEINSKRIRMLPMEDAVCPQHLCSNTGWIKEPWQTIVCIPNQLVVKIEGKPYQQLDFDAISY